MPFDSGVVAAFVPVLPAALLLLLFERVDRDVADEAADDHIEVRDAVEGEERRVDREAVEAEGKREDRDVEEAVGENDRGVDGGEIRGVTLGCGCGTAW